MVVRVLSYTSIEQLYAKDSIFLNEYADVIHITATSSLRKGLVEHNQSQRWIEAPIISFGQMVKFIGDDWFKGETLLKQSISLTHTYNDFSLEVDDKEMFGAFDKNQHQLLLTIRALVEAGVTINELLNFQNILSKEETMLVQLWGKMQHLTSIQKYEKWFEKLENPQNIYSTIRAVLEDTLIDAYKEKNKRKGINALPYVPLKGIYEQLNKKYKGNQEKIREEITRLKVKEVIEDTFDKKKTLVFHGFYFVTPVQRRLLKILEQSEIDVIYLIFYDSRYPRLFKTVDKFLPMDIGEKVSHYEVPMNTNAITLAKAMHGDFDKMPPLRNPIYTVFEQLYELKEYVEDNPEEKIFSPRAASIEKYFDDLTTASTARLKDFPIGQFLIDLHRFSKLNYELKDGEYIHSDEVDANILIRLFNSGYLSIPSEDGLVIQGKSLVKPLIYLKSRFADCRTFADWKSELTYFINQKRMFEQELTPPSIEINEDNELYLFLHRDISYYSVSDTHLSHIYQGICILESFYNSLYTDTNLSIKNYISQIETILFKRLKPNFSSEDNEMAEFIMQQIKTLDQEEFEGINRNDLIKGLAFYLSSSMEQNEVTEKVEEDKVLGDPKISALVDIDGFMFKRTRQLHLAFMDNKALPLSQGYSLWPLREEVLELLMKSNTNTLKQLKIRQEETGSITSYLLYMGLQKATNVNFSIVKNVETEHHLVNSFYLQLLGLSKAAYRKTKKGKTDTQYAMDKAMPINIHLSSRNRHHILDQTYLNCQRRFIASYLLQSRPAFNSEFHLRFLYLGLVTHYEKLYKNTNGRSLTKDEKEKIRLMIDNLFPQWTQTRKDLYYRDVNLRYGAIDTVSVNQYKFETSRRPTTLFGLSFIGKTDSISQTSYVPENKIVHAKNCKYCPFQLSCRESVKVSEDKV